MASIKTATNLKLVNGLCAGFCAPLGDIITTLYQQRDFA